MIHDFYLKIEKHLPLILVIFFLCWGIYWRSSNWEGYSLGFDQVQILSQAEKITHGQFTLIGPRTGPAATFTGPLIYYLTTFIQIISNPIVSAVATPLILSLTTGLALFFLSKHYLNFKAALLILAIWASAPLLLHLDRIFWNPNLSLLSFSLIFWPILLVKKAQKLDLWLVFSGAFLSYQAHFSSFMLIPLVASLVIFFRIDKKYLFALSLGFIFTLLPTFLFDLRHDWLNLRGLLNFGDQQSQKITGQLIFYDWLKNLAIIAETLGKFFYQFASFQKRVVFGSALFMIIFFLILKNKKLSLWPSLNILFVITVILAFYQGAKPEYYFLITVPILLIMLAQISSKIPNYLLAFFFTSQLIFSRQFMLKENKSNLELSLGNCIKIQKAVKNIQNIKGINFLAYDLPYASDSGIKYLLEPISLVEGGVSVHLLYPSSEDIESFQLIGSTAIIIEE